MSKVVKLSSVMEREEKLNIRKLEQYYTESLPVLQSNFFCSIMEGQICSGDIY